MTITATDGGTLGSYNVGLAAAAGLLTPMAAQLDALLSAGLGPFQADLNSQLNAAISAQATLTLQIGNPIAALQAAIASLAQLIASLTLALALPPVHVGLGAELGATAALIGSLSARLGVLKAAISLALKVKLGALSTAADLQAHLGTPGIAAVTFSGETVAANGTKLASLLGGASVDGYSLVGALPADTVAAGVLFLATDASAGAALNAIITV